VCWLLLQVTEGPDAGKLALLDFGLVAEIPAQDRAAMVSATIHLVSLLFFSGDGSSSLGCCLCNGLGLEVQSAGRATHLAPTAP
jgi:hypothetical protein